MLGAVHGVTPLELLFDLVFVLAFTQVTRVLLDDPTWGGLGQGLLILAALWWAWAAYAWLTNTVDPDEGVVLAAMLVAMAAMFVTALAVPSAFGDHGVLFGVAFLVVNVMHRTLFTLAARGDPDLLGAILRTSPATFIGCALILAAGFVDGGSKYVPLGGRARRRLPRAAVHRPDRLARGTVPLHRAARADHDHRDR